MSRLSFYILKQLIGPVALFAFLVTCVVWLTTSLTLLDLVINRGQSAPTFVYLTILVLPTLLVIILPLAYLFGTLYALDRLNSESELVVMASAGFSRSQLAAPVLLAAAIVMALTYLCGLYLMPAGQRALNEKVVGIRANIGAALLNEGTFNAPAKGLTVFIRSIDDDGTVHGILVHDNRNRKSPISYLAQSGHIVQTPMGARLVMIDGTIEQSSRRGSRLSILRFDRDVFDLDQFSNPQPVSARATNERYLGELLSPDPHLSPRIRKAYFAEANNRITQPLYCITFALIALAAVTRGRRARGAHLLRMTFACAAAAGIRIAGYGVAGLAAGNSTLCVLFYVIPFVGAVGALFVLFGAYPKPMPASVVAEAVP
jgi:lipopolysaccharide export system permease protein